MSPSVGTLVGMQPAQASGARVQRELDSDSQAWLADLRAEGHVRDAAVGRLHELLLRAARFEVSRRSGSLAFLRGRELDELARDSAGDAVVAVLARLDEFRGLSKFTTWAYKFAILETAVKVRRRAWRAREIPRAADGWDLVPDDRPSPEREAEQRELIAAVRDAMATALTAHQREVLVAIALNDVPIDILAERLNTTRGALYKTLHDARRKLRATLSAAGLDLATSSGGAA